MGGLYRTACYSPVQKRWSVYVAHFRGPRRRNRSRLGRSLRTARTRNSCPTALQHPTRRPTHHRKLRQTACAGHISWATQPPIIFTARRSSHAVHPLSARTSRRHPWSTSCADATNTVLEYWWQTDLLHTAMLLALEAPVGQQVSRRACIDLSTHSAAASWPELGACAASARRQRTPCWVTAQRCCCHLSGFCGTPRHGCQGA